jgi:TPR repeat protein
MVKDPYLMAWNEMHEGGDESKSRELLERASALGDPRASYALATWDLAEATIEGDQNAFRRLRHLTDARITEALFDLAVCYHAGKGTRKNLRLAFRYYTMAAVLGDADACEEVANFFYYGVVVHRDRRISDAWQQRADGIREGTVAKNGLSLDPKLRELR